VNQWYWCRATVVVSPKTIVYEYAMLLSFAGVSHAVLFTTGEMGYMRLAMGKNLLGIEGEVAWVTPGTFTVHNFPCTEDGKNCDHRHRNPVVETQTYTDPSQNIELVQRRLSADRHRSKYMRA
jgi:hypothetical protein